MPHDCKGRKIDIGDVIIARPYNQTCSADKIREYVGTVVDMHSQEQSCTGQMRYLGYPSGSCVEVELMKDYFGAEDATLILKHNGSLPEVVE